MVPVVSGDSVELDFDEFLGMREVLVYRGRFPGMAPHPFGQVDC